MKIFVGISGASGQVYAGRLIPALFETGNDVTVCFSNGAVEVIRAEETEAGASAPGTQQNSRDGTIDAFLARYGISAADIEIADPEDMSSAFASGSALADAAIVCPCSMSSLACIATGITRNLIHRVADVMLKEGRPLIVVPRETPLSEIHLKNMLRLKRAGAHIVPAMPAFYHHPQTIDDLTGFVVGKVLDVLLIRHNLFERWKG